ncbi:MAG: hypothetical protein CBD95_005510 [Flavobacteriales bacterium TMED235]|nr:MAG: hypothetical protein CBD95_005510 [Flavobacteriales bacterium TMED235]
MKIKKLFAYFLIVSITIPILLYVLVNIFAGAGRKIDKPIELGEIKIPTRRTLSFYDNSELKQNILDGWTSKTPQDWKPDEKVNLKNSRIVISCFLEGKRVEEMNKYLMRQKAVGHPGSPWLLYPLGDYDFTAMAFTALLYLFGEKPDILYPKTREHLLNNILTIEGDKFRRNVGYMFLEDSENHILMTEGSRYLKNQWLRNHGNNAPEYNNKTNGVEKKLKVFLEEIDTYGFYEFNSAPYLGYTYCALLNLYEFASGDIRSLSGKLLDRLNWQYALSSYKFKHFPPNRRRFGKDFKKNIDSDYHTVMLKVWASLYDDSLSVNMSRGQHHALWATFASYKPADKVIQWVLDKPKPYFVKMGHGFNSCPEILSGDKSYLLSAGGANQGRRSLIVAKPIMLFLDDDASEMKHAFHMFGPGGNFVDWNNTGVYQDFACTKGKVHIPVNKKVLKSSGNWKIFLITKGIYLATYSKDELGLMVIVRSNSVENILEDILKKNSDEKKLSTYFNHPNGNIIEYDLNSPKDQWVIKSVNKISTNRNFSKWDFFDF